MRKKLVGQKTSMMALLEQKKAFLRKLAQIKPGVGRAVGIHGFNSGRMRIWKAEQKLLGEKRKAGKLVKGIDRAFSSDQVNEAVGKP